MGRLILIVEDDANDRFFLNQAFKGTGLEDDIHFSVSAEEAIEYMKAGHLPSTIVTDLNMPGMGGLGLLEFIKAEAEYRRIPTIVFSGSDDLSDVEEAYNRQANSYVVKPKGVAGYQAFVKSFRDYWLEQNRTLN